MIWMFVIISVMIVLTAILWFLRIQVSVHFVQTNVHTEGEVHVSAVNNSIKKTWKVPYVRFDSETLSFVFEEDETGINHRVKKRDIKQETPRDIGHRVSDTKTLFKRITDLIGIISRFLETVQVKEIKWKTEIGTGDAAVTGTSVGLLWGLKTSVCAFLSHRMNFERLPYLSIQPFFQAAVFSTEIKCIASFRIGHAIRAMIAVWMHSRKKSRGSHPYDQHVSKGA